MNRRKFIATTGAAVSVTALAGCTGGSIVLDAEAPLESIQTPSEEPLRTMVLFSDYFNGHRDEPPSVPFDVDNLEQPWEYIVKTMEAQAEDE